MNILVADDDPVSRLLVEESLSQWGHHPVVAEDGRKALDALQAPGGPRLAILDWVMPGMSGPEVCQVLRAASSLVYVILLTAKEGTRNLVVGLRSGADDYITKPFEPAELRARLNVGLRVLRMQESLTDRVRELELALAHVKRLQGLVPICSGCKKVRDDQNYWQQVEEYVSDRSEARFTHGICPECSDKVRGEMQ